MTPKIRTQKDRVKSLIGPLKLQIAMASRGAIGGRLNEWPILHEALETLDIKLSNETDAYTLSIICRLIVRAYPEEFPKEFDPV